MWLEQTVSIWAPLACAAVIWMILRLAALGSEVRNLRKRVDQLECVQSDPAAQGERARPTQTAA
jgi:hypothetical protein